MQSWHVNMLSSRFGCFCRFSLCSHWGLLTCLSRATWVRQIFKQEFGICGHLNQLTRCVLYMQLAEAMEVLPHLDEMHCKARLRSYFFCALFICCLEQCELLFMHACA